MAKGTVKRWLKFRGYGFIEPEGGGEDIFVHNSEVQGKDSLNEGDKVEYEVISSYKGPKATNVKLISE
jgi:CspA family cold shock protein